MRYLVAALLMAAGLAGLVVDAIADDAYYDDGSTSHWDHAVRTGTAPLVVGAAVVAAAATLWVLTRFRAAAAPPTPALIAAVMVYAFWLSVAFTFLGIGH